MFDDEIQRQIFENNIKIQFYEQKFNEDEISDNVKGFYEGKLEAYRDMRESLLKIEKVFCNEDKSS